MSARNLVGDSVAALVALLGVDPATLPVDRAEMAATLQREAFEQRLSWDRSAQIDRDHDRAARCRRWSKAIEAAWDLAALELDVASGRRRAGWVA